MRLLVRLATLLVAVILAAPLVSVIAPAHAKPTSTISAASPAAQASADARVLRRDVAGLLQKYIDEYGDRFTPSERGQLLGYKNDADRQLASVVTATKRLQLATASRASLAKRRSAGADAQAAWRRAKATADSTMSSAQQIMQPRLSLMEQLSALQDYNTMTRRFDDLGARIDAAARAASR